MFSVFWFHSSPVPSLDQLVCFPLSLKKKKCCVVIFWKTATFEVSEGSTSLLAKQKCKHIQRQHVSKNVTFFCQNLLVLLWVEWTKVVVEAFRWTINSQEFLIVILYGWMKLKSSHEIIHSRFWMTWESPICLFEGRAHETCLWRLALRIKRKKFKWKCWK